MLGHISLNSDVLLAMLAYNEESRSRPSISSDVVGSNLETLVRESFAHPR